MNEKDRFQKLKLNSVLALSYQVILIVTGLILPRFFLYYYGSEVNGLITSITQFLSFINICDFGISAVVTSSYYKPLAEKDTYNISRVYLYSKRFFNIIGSVLVVYVIGLIFIYPSVSNADFDFVFTATLIGAMAISQFGQYFLGIAYQLIIDADQRSYIHLIINGSTLLINTICCIILMMCGSSIQIVKLTTSLIYLIRPLAMCLYVRKQYKLDYNVPFDSSVVPQKRNGIIQHLAYIIYQNTDVMVLTFFSTLKNVSVYSIYTLVTNSIKQIINSCTNGVEPLMGNMIAKNEKQSLISFYNFYNWGLHTISTVLYTVCGFLIVPFIMIYTKGVNDVNYSAPVFAVLNTIVGYLGTLRNGNFSLIRAAGKYKETQWASVAEALLNLGISIVAVFNFGLIGVAIGTIAATVFFIIFETYYFSKNILNLNISNTLRLFIIDLSIVIVSLLLLSNVNIYNGSIISWIIDAIITTSGCLLITLTIQLIFYRKYLVMLLNKILLKIRRK